MVDEDKLRELKDRIETAKTSNTPNHKKIKRVVLDLDLRLALKSLPH